MSSILRCFVPCVLALLLAACNSAAPPPAASAQASAASADPLADDGHGDGFEYRIRYPELAPEWSALDRALRGYAAQRKQQLKDAAAAAPERGANAASTVLDLEFNVARRTEDFISVLAQGSVHSGNGGEPIAASFVLHTGDNRLLTLADLFTDAPAAVKALSVECTRQLEGRFEAALRESVGDGAALAPALQKMQQGVEHGTSPDAANFAVFLIDGIDSKAIGLTLIFTQAQLAMTSGGEQQLEVPSKVFYELLKPDLRDAFSVDVKEIAADAR